MNLCELIHSSRSGNLSGSRIPHPGLVSLYPGHFVDAQAQSHPGVAGRHPHDLPIRHIASGHGSHPVHDAKAIKESGFLTTLDSQSHIGDKGYIGFGMITPTRKPAHGELTNIDRRNNTAINRVRISSSGALQISRSGVFTRTDYRRSCGTFEITIQAVAGLIFAYTL